METITLSRPKSGGVPEGFPHSKARPLQRSAIEEISSAWERGYKYVFLEAPTGSGKSAIAITLARQNPKAFILVSTKTLQDQYARERSNRTIKVRGRSNFPCLMYDEKRSCDLGPCSAGADCDHRPRRFSEEVPAEYEKVAVSGNQGLYMPPGKRICHYWRQKCMAMNHDYPVMNYAYFLNETGHAGDFSKRRVMICDEAHTMEDELMRFIEFRVTDNDLSLINCRIPRKKTSVKGWIENLREWEGKLKEELKHTDRSLERTMDGGEKLDKMKKMTSLFKKIEKCAFIADALSRNRDNWVIDREVVSGSGRVIFKPIFVSEWGSKFFGKADMFLLQSATIIDAEAMAESLGLPEGDCIFLRSGSCFSPEKRPVYYRPAGRMSRTAIKETLPVVINDIRKLMEKYPDRKGVIHTHTYKIQSSVLEGISSERFIANKSGDPEGRDKVMRRFIHSREPLVLVTPSAYEGMDFKGEICRWQVICKMPYPDLGDSQIRKRMELDRSWYQWKTMLRLVQTYGRGVRSERDWCDSYILDASFENLVRRNRKLFPEWFIEAVVR